jgi:hypothetical protein
MYVGKPLFAQIMDFLPWKTFHRIVDRHCGDHRVRTLSCAEHFRILAFAQLTYRESLRDIEACLSAQSSKLYHMGIRCAVSRSTLADANELRDWRIYAEFGQRLIVQARLLYVSEDLGIDLTNTVYALDSTTIDLCLSVFPWANFRTTKAAVKMHTLLDLRGSIPSFIHVSDGKMHDVRALDLLIPEAGAIYVMDRAYVDFMRLHRLHLAGAFFVTRAKSNMDAHRMYSATTDRSLGIICDQTIALDGIYTQRDYPEPLRRIRFKDPETGKTLVFLTNNFTLPAATICAALQEPLAGGVVLQVGEAASSYPTFLWHIRECSEVANLDRRFCLRTRRHYQEASQSGRLALHFVTDSVSHAVRENAHTASLTGHRAFFRRSRPKQPTESIRFLTGH